MKDVIVWEGDTPGGHYQIIDMMYDNRPARVLYSGQKRAAQSGVALDSERDLLFDYNQRLFELATSLVPKRLLLIGGAVATLPLALMRALPDISIDIVEPNAKLIELAHTYFGVPKTERLRAYYQDGLSFLQGHSQCYDMIIVDAFAHTTIPANLRSAGAFRHYAEHLEKNGVFAMNIISNYHGSGSHVLGGMYDMASQIFQHVDIFLASRGYSLWLPQNFILTGHNRDELTLRDYVRHDAVEPPSLRRNILDD
jgi:spermidine synthase